MKLIEVLKKLCAYDSKSPYQLRKYPSKAFLSGNCTCINCQSGRSELASELIKSTKYRILYLIYKITN